MDLILCPSGNAACKASSLSCCCEEKSPLGTHGGPALLLLLLPAVPWGRRCSPLRSAAAAPLCCSLAPAPPSEAAPSLGSPAPSAPAFVEKSLELKLPFRVRVKGDLVGREKEKSEHLSG